MSFRFTPQEAIPDVVLVEADVHRDARGYFLETFSASAFEKAGLPRSFLYTAQSHSVGRGLLRGLHFQIAPAAQGKLVRCSSGECFDVAVDIRRGSPTFGGHVTAALRADAGNMLWIPPGFAHGFVTLSDACDLEYRFTGSEYSSQHARVLRWDDPALGIRWPIERPVMLAPKDASAPRLAELLDAL